MAKLVSTPKHPEGELEQKYQREGWKLLTDGKRVFRYRLLCRKCIGELYDREERQREYERQCKKARGIDDRTYSQILAMQANG